MADETYDQSCIAGCNAQLEYSTFFGKRRVLCTFFKHRCTFHREAGFVGNLTGDGEILCDTWEKGTEEKQKNKVLPQQFFVHNGVFRFGLIVKWNVYRWGR